jgi:hypothetical protein
VTDTTRHDPRVGPPTQFSTLSPKFLITADGYRELVTSLSEGGDQYIDRDVVFGVSSSLIVQARPDPASPFPELDAIHYDFGLARAAVAGEARVGADPSKLVSAGH